MRTPIKIAAVLLLFVLIGNIARMQWGEPDSFLEITLKATEDGRDVTQDYKYYVGPLPEGERGELTLGTIEVLRPIDQGGHIYLVPRNRSIGVFVLRKDKPTVKAVFQVKKGMILRKELILEDGSTSG